MKHKLKEKLTSALLSHGLFSVGCYWWRGMKGEPWQIVEVYEQDGEIMCARHGRSYCVPLSERRGEWGSPIFGPSITGFCRAAFQAILGGVLACIEAPLSWVGLHKQTGRINYLFHSPSCGYYHCLSHLSGGGLMPLAVILPYCRFRGRSAPTSARCLDSCFLLESVKVSAPARKQSSPLDNKNRK